MMTRYMTLACAIWPFLICLPAFSQCDSGTSNTIGTAYALRSGGQMLTYVDAYVTGPDAEYDTTTVVQYDTLNGFALGSPLTTSVGPCFEAATQRITDIAAAGYGVYQTQGHVSVHDSCSGVTFPPFSSGSINGITNVASATVIQPTISGVTQLYNQIYLGTNTAGSAPGYNNNGEWVAYFPGATGTPEWTFSGDTSGVSGICTSCTYMTFTTSPNATTGCFVAFTATFTVDGLTSSPQGMMILSPQLADGTSPMTGQHVDDVGIPGGPGIPSGYQSEWYFQDVDSCENPMPYINNHEVFPGCFYYRYTNSNWTFPTADSWIAGPNGGFVDEIGETAISGAIPTPIAPLSPLGTVDVYDSAQQFFVDSNVQGGGPSFLIWSGVQTHYQDHGGHR